MSIHWKLPALLAACALSLSVHAETVETIRVFAYDAPSGTADGRCAPGTAPGTPGKWYEVTYAYRGKIFREIIGYDPGKTIELLASGKPQSVPYDNKR